MHATEDMSHEAHRVSCTRNDTHEYLAENYASENAQACATCLLERLHCSMASCMKLHKCKTFRNVVRDACWLSEAGSSYACQPSLRLPLLRHHVHVWDWKLPVAAFLSIGNLSANRGHRHRVQQRLQRRWGMCGTGATARAWSPASGTTPSAPQSACASCHSQCAALRN